MKFFPLTLLVLAILVAVNWENSGPVNNRGRRISSLALFAVAVSIFLYSVIYFSPWLSHVAFILVFAAWAIGRFEKFHWGGLAGWTLLLASTLPLPWGWDIGIIYWLQSISVWATTCALDALGIACLQNGNLLEIKGLSVFSEQVCDGAGSLFAYISFAMVLLAVQHRSLIVSLCTLILVPFWSVLANFIRLLTITTFYQYYENNLASGRDFLLLQAATVVLTMLLIWLCSAFFRHLLEPVPAEDTEFGPVFSGLNKLFHWPMPDPLESTIPDDPKERKLHEKRAAAKLARQRSLPQFDWLSSPQSLWLVRCLAVLMLVASVMPVLGMSGPGLQNIRFGVPRIAANYIEANFGEASMPETVGNSWTRAHFVASPLGARNPFGQYNLAWTYLQKPKQFVASISLPMVGWQDPVARRQRIGWKTQRVRLRWTDGWPACEAEMENELGGKAYLFYCLFTADGKPFTAVPSSLNSLSSIEIPSGITAMDPNSETRIFQLFTETGEELQEQEILLYREHFQTLRNSALSLGQGD